MNIESDDCMYCEHYEYCLEHNWPGCRGFQGKGLDDTWGK